MKYLLFGAMLTTAIAAIALTARANQIEAPAVGVPVPEQLDREIVLAACRQNRAETLPNPFIDVPRNHWAFKAVSTMHYCGVFRQATPESLPERSKLLRPAITKD